MNLGRPPGLDLDPESTLPVRQFVAEVGSRGRIYFPPWLIVELNWLSPSSRVLVVLDEPGLIQLFPWTPFADSVLARRRELAAADDLESIASLQDRYRAMNIPADSRPIFGDSAMVHLGVTERRRPYVYLSRVGESFKIMSPQYRNRDLARVRAAFDSLP
jgi:hypothetical protein